MNFFESQDSARKHSFQLVSLFILAVACLIVTTNLLVMLVFGFINAEQMQNGELILRQIDWQTFATVSAAVGVVVLVGSLYKMLNLSAGGKAVAESLGGKLIPSNTDDPKLRKLLNVVEEISIASGTAAPPVYVLVNEAGINAFAAGFSPRDAVIGVTQGTIEHLSREQLQGVIAHEFSHIFNGDMRLNIRLIGVLNGILIIGILGYYLLYSASFSRRGRGNDKAAVAMLALAIGLMVIGYAGTFFGGLIKAAVSRQREYLADASAVQFTRNPDGIAGALKRIGGLEAGSKVENPGASEVSHSFFAQGVTGFMQSLSSTHPPLAERVLRIDPHWDGKFNTTDQPDSLEVEEKSAEEEVMTRAELAHKVSSVAAGAAMVDVANAIGQIGNPEQETVNHARAMVAELPILFKESAREPYGARAVVYSLVLDKEGSVHDLQLRHLQDHADPDVFVLTQKLLTEMKKLDIKYRLLLIDIAIPALKQLSLNQYQIFKQNLVVLIEMDARVELLEWTLQKILFSHLDGQFFKLKPAQRHHFRSDQLKPEIALLLSVMAYASDQDQNEIDASFAAAVKTLDIRGLQLAAKNKTTLPDLDQTLQQLANLNPRDKPKLLLACATSAAHDNNISVVEVELLRAFADVLDCPMPPVIS